MMAMTVEELTQIANAWRTTLIQHYDAEAITVIEGESTVGGGSLPGATLPTSLLAIRVSSPDNLMQALRKLSTPIIGRISDDTVLFDPRTVYTNQSSALTDGLTKVLTKTSI